jgi:hypothetical protein
VKIYTTHMRPDRAPVLVREGFSWTAFVFGALFFLAHRAWNAFVLNLAALVLAAIAARGLQTAAPLLGVFVLQGVLGNDLLRWGLSMHGYVPGPVVAAGDQDSALARLIDERVDLIGDMNGLGASF